MLRERLIALTEPLLARVWGVSQSSAAAGAAAYGLSGYFLSQLNLYTAVAAAALAPALAAAALEAGSLSHRRRGVMAAGAIWSSGKSRCPSSSNSP